jgi:DtxR family Mn-dependent transcriptional regulator
MTLTPIQEDYLETIYRLSADSVGVRTTDIADRLGCRLPTVTRTVRKMVQAGYLEHESRGLVRLTPFGLRAAENLTHRHADTVRFLTTVLGLSSDDAEVDACQIEHGLSPAASQRLHEFLEYIATLSPSVREAIASFAQKTSLGISEFAHLPAARSAGWRG